MFEDVKVVTQLSRVVKRNKDNHEMGSMLIAREERKSIISYVYFSRICHVIKCFPDLIFLENKILILFNNKKFKNHWMAETNLSKL